MALWAINALWQRNSMKYYQRIFSLQILVFVFFSHAVVAEQAAPETNNAPAQATASAPQPTTPGATPPKLMVVLPTSDTSGLNLGNSLQYALVSLSQQDPRFKVQMGSYALSSFNAQEIANAHQVLSSQVLSLCYLERDRVTLYLFDVSRPKELILSSQALNDQAAGQPLNASYVEYKFRNAYNQLMAAYSQELFQPLPANETPSAVSSEEPEDVGRRAEEARRLYLELAAMEEKRYYVGANIGMARFAGAVGSSSNISFGGFGGMSVSSRTRLELGIDLFSYAMIHAEARYSLPLSHRLVTLQASLGLAKIVGSGFGNTQFDTTQLNPGGILLGPGLSFNIPLLGTSLRGDLRFYLGSGSVFMGSYGVSYSI